MTHRRRRPDLLTWAIWCAVLLCCAVLWLLVVVGAVTVLRR